MVETVDGHSRHLFKAPEQVSAHKRRLTPEELREQGLKAAQIFNPARKLEFYRPTDSRHSIPVLNSVGGGEGIFQGMDTETLLPADNEDLALLHGVVEASLSETSLPNKDFARYVSTMIDLTGGTTAPKDGVKSATLTGLFDNVRSITLIHKENRESLERTGSVIIETTAASSPRIEFYTTDSNGNNVIKSADTKPTERAIVEMTGADNDGALYLAESSVTIMLRNIHEALKKKLGEPTVINEHKNLTAQHKEQVETQAGRGEPANTEGTVVFLGMPQKIAA